MAHISHLAQFIIKMTVNVQQFLKTTSKLMHMNKQQPKVKA